MKINFNVTIDDWVYYQLHLQKIIMKPNSVKSKLLNVVVFVVAIYTVSFYVLFDASFLLVIILCYGGLYLFSYFYKRKVFRLFAPSNPGIYLGPQVLELDKNGIFHKGELFTHKYEWNIVKSVELTNDYIYVFIDRVSGLVVPKREVEDIDKLYEFINISRSTTASISN